jgi:hypothetical protein
MKFDLIAIDRKGFKHKVVEKALLEDIEDLNTQEEANNFLIEMSDIFNEMTTPEDKKIEGTIPVLALLSEKTG